MAETQGKHGARNPHDRGDKKRGCGVADTGQRRAPDNACAAPSVLTREKRNRRPMVRHHRVKYADGYGSEEQQQGLVRHDTPLIARGARRRLEGGGVSSP